MLILQGKNRGTKRCRAQGRGLTSHSLALAVLAELEGPLDEVFGPFSPHSFTRAVFFGSADPTLELETQGQKSTFS